MSFDAEMEEIAKVFFEESFEGLNAMESGLLTLDEHADQETINDIFRAAHSIKGGAGTFGFMEISNFTHGVETLLDEMRNGRRAVTADAVQMALQAVDVTRAMLQAAQEKRSIDMAAANALSAELARLLANDTAPPATRKPAVTTTPEQKVEASVPTQSGWRITFIPDLNLLTTCNDPIRIMNSLSQLGSAVITPNVDMLPSVRDLNPTLCYLSWVVELQGAVPKEQIAEVFDWVEAVSTIRYEPLFAAAAIHTDELPPPVAPLAASVATPVTAVLSKAGTDSGSIRVATDKVDALVNLVGELVITQSMLAGFAVKDDSVDFATLRRGLVQLARNTRELQDSVMQIRMLPMGFSFNRFPRLVHDLSRQLGKKVELRLSGESTEVDKTVLEKISDPLVHLVRNSLDHGLETPEVRLAAGKPATGVLELNAYHEGGGILIEVKDDGAGLNKARILKKAREKGLLKENEHPNDEDTHKLIFAAGFSTADAVSDLSGRGVGMDVVRSNIQDLGGQVEIISHEGIGSTIRIRLPLTLAILEGQVLRVGREIYVVSLVSIIETVQPRSAQLSSVAEHNELLRHRDTFLPIIRLHDLFSIEPDSRSIVDGLLVVVEADGRRAAIFVDELLAHQQFVIKSLESNFKQVTGLAGATIHGDGTVALILDVPGLITSFNQRESKRLDFAA